MSVRLSTSKLEELEGLTSTLLAPLDHAEEDDWLNAVNRGAAKLFAADGVLSTLPAAANTPLFAFHDIDSRTARTLQQITVGGGDGTLLFRYPGLTRMMRRLATARVRVWTPELAEHITRVPVAEMAFTREVAVPARIMHQANLAVPLGDGMALIGVYHESPDRDPLQDNRVPLLHLLLPAFRSGVRALLAFRRHREAIGEQFDAMPAPVVAFDTQGRLLHRNRAAIALFADERLGGLLQEVEALADHLSTLRNPPRKSGPDSPCLPGEREVECGGERFRLSTSFLPAGLLDRDWTMLVRVERLSPVLPSVERIRKETGLTPRQAEVARLIAQDYTSAQVAELLGISVHTVRRHADKILPRLGVRSRKGIAARLLGIVHRVSPGS